MTLKVKTTRSDPFEFLTNTVQKWLTENKEREGAPYSIKHIEWTLVGEEVIPKGEEQGGVPGFEPLAGKPRDGGPRRPGEFDPNNPYGLPPPEIISTARPQGGTGGDVNQLAPLPKAPPVAPPRTMAKLGKLTNPSFFL